MNRKKYRRFLSIAMLPLIVMGIALVAHAQDLAPEGETVPPAADTVPPPEATPTGPEEVHIGLFLHHVPELDLRTNSYLADFYLWFRWNGPLDPT